MEKTAKIEQKVKANPLHFLVDFGHFFNFLKTGQKPRLNALESFSTTPLVVLGLFEPFLES